MFRKALYLHTWLSTGVYASRTLERMCEMGKREMAMKELNERAISELKKSYKNAKKYFRLNAKINPSYRTYNNLAWYYFICEELNPFWYDLSTFKKSTKNCIKALRLKTNISSLRLLRDIHYAKKEYGKAKDIQERIFVSFEGDQDIENYIDDHYVMGCINIGLKDYESAEKFLKKAYEHYYSKQTLNEDYAFFTYALCLAKVGKYNEANQIGDYILGVLGAEGTELLHILSIYYYTNSFEKVREFIDELEQKWDINEDVLAIILLTYKNYYSNEEVNRKYIEIISKISKGYYPRRHKKNLAPLKRIYNQISNGIKPEIKYEPLRYFINNYIKC